MTLGAAHVDAEEERADVAGQPVEAPEMTAVDGPEEIEPDEQPMSESEPAKLEPAPTFSEDKKAQVSLFITNSQKQQLRERGYSDSDIAKMRPAEADKILGSYSMKPSLNGYRRHL